MKTTLRSTIAVLSLITFAVLLRAYIPQVPTGTWVAGASLSTARSGASAVLLPDGRILIVGGTDANGAVLASTEVVNTDGSISSVAPMSVARTGAAAIALPMGDVLVTGGTTSDGGTTNSAELYDPLRDAWHTLSATMASPRSGHTISPLLSGDVLIAGGDSSSGRVSSLEIFDETNNSFSQVGTLATGRKDHAAAVLQDGRVLIAGGTVIGADGNPSSLSSTEIFDPNAGAVSDGPSLSSACARLSATTLLDGKVLVVGGNDGTNDLASAEIFDPATGSFSAASASMSAPRSGHQAFLLPNNNSVLIVGGSSAGNAVASAELYIPWTGAFQATGSMASARALAAGAPAQQDGLLFVAGGNNADNAALSSGELYGFATVRTDQGDYAPGMTVTITGGGWQPGETVTLMLVESPNLDTHPPMTAIADASGHIFNNQFVPDEHDINVRFYLTAVGSVSQAQSTFTDGTPQIDSATPSPFSPNQASSAGVNDSTTITAKNSGTGPITDFRIRIHAGTATGTLVKEFLCGSTAGNGTCTKTWDGKDGSNNFVADGTYVALASNVTTETTSPASKTGIIVVDNTNPSVTLTSPINNAFVSGNNLPLVASPVDAGGNDSNIDKVEFYIDGSLVGTSTGAGGWNFNLNTTTLSDGDHTWSAKAFDKAGNNASSSTFTIRVDNTKPTVAVDSVSNGSVGVLKTITGTADDLPALLGYGVASVQVTINPPSGPNIVGAATDTGTNFSTWSFSFTPSVGGTYSVVAKATDQAGNFTNSSPQNFNVVSDSTPPVITPNVSGTLGTNGWYTSDVTVSWTVTDSESAISSQTGCGSTTITADTTGTTLTCSATSAGGTSSNSVTIKRDATPPSAALSVTAGTLGSNGWYTSDVTVHTSGTDSISSPVTCTADQFQTTETASTVFNGSCTNDAGLTTNAAPLTIKLDKTGPSATLAVTAGTPGANGWYTSDVTVSTSGSDSISGPVTCTADQFQTAETTGALFNGSCTNDAGLTANAAPLTVKLDKTGPTASLAILVGTLGDNGWYTTDVTVRASGTDTISTPVKCTADQVFSTDSADQIVNADCTNDAGLVTHATALHFKLDKTPPTATLAVTAGTAGTNGWYTSDVTITASGTDNVSGPVSCTPVTQYQTAETTGTTFNASCKNQAGLTANAAPLTIKLDKTGPSATLAVSAGTLGDNGWYTSNVTIHASGSDSISNPVSCSSDQFLTTDSSGTTFNGSCTNDAGLTTNAAPLTVKRDATPPVVGVTGVSSGATYTLGAVPAAGCTTSDATSGVAVNASLNLTGGVPPGVGSFTAVCNGAKDNAGNTNSASATYSVVYSTGACLGSPGHAILQPIDLTGASVFPKKQGSTVPAKFRVCDALGNSISTAGVVTDFRIIQIFNGTATQTVNEDVASTTPDSAFRWDSSGGQWIYNISTKLLNAGNTYYFRIWLNDGTNIDFQFGLK